MTGDDEVSVVAGRSRRSRVLEAIAVLLGSCLLTVVTNHDQLTGLTTTVPGSLGDPLYFAWQLAWVGHAVRTDPGSLWTTNAFSGAPDNLAFTDVVWGYLPLSFVVPPGQAGALAQLNLAGLLATMSATAGGYALARVLGSRVSGAMVAGAGFGFAPWRLTQVIHLNVISTAGIAVTFALLAYGHGWSLGRGWRPSQVRPAWALVAWLVAAWQLTFGFATGIWFVYSLALAMGLLALGWLLKGRHRPDGTLSTRLLAADAAGALLFVAWAWLLVEPHLRVVGTHPEARRSETALRVYSPPWPGLVTASDDNWFWSMHPVSWRRYFIWPAEMLMSPGIALLALAAVGLFFSSWGRRQRLALLAVVAVLVTLAQGTAVVAGGAWTYLPLFRHLPGWDSLRTPGRLMIWVTLGLCLLAAGAVDHLHHLLARAWRRRTDEGRPTSWRGSRLRSPAAALAATVVVLLPAGLVAVEGLNVTPHLPVATSPVALADLPQPILILPTGLLADYHLMLWSTQGWPRIANGDSGFDSQDQQRLRREAATFPDEASIAELRRRGIATVVVVRSRTDATHWPDAADRPVRGLDITRSERGDAVVFDLRAGVP